MGQLREFFNKTKKNLNYQGITTNRTWSKRKVRKRENDVIPSA